MKSQSTKGAVSVIILNIVAKDSSAIGTSKKMPTFTIKQWDTIHTALDLTENNSRVLVAQYRGTTKPKLAIVSIVLMTYNKAIHISTKLLHHTNDTKKKQ